MKEYTQLLENLTKEYPEWEENYPNFQTFTEQNQKLINNVELDLLEDIMKTIDSTDENYEKIIKDIFNESHSVFAKKYIDRFGNYLLIYQDMKVMRENENVMKFIKDAIINGYIEYDELFYNEYNKYGVDNKNDFVNSVNAIKNVISNHVIKHFSRSMAKKEFEKVTGIVEPGSDIYADIYIMYFDRIQRIITLDLLLNNH